MLRSALLLLILSLLLHPTLWAQHVSGTVVVLEDGGDYIVIAADSLSLGPGAGQVSHTACKIVKLSDQLVFAVSGISAYLGAANTSRADMWNAKDIARQEFSALAGKHPDNLIQKLAAAYGENLTSRINHELKVEPAGPLRSYLAEQGRYGAAVFAGFDEQHQRVVVEVSMGIRAAGGMVGYTTKVLPGGEDTMEAEVFGHNTIATELAEGRTERSRGWRSTITLRSTGLGLRDRMLFEAKYVAELTAQYDPDHVGGPIDEVLVTRKRGVTWVHRKPACGSKD